MGFYIVSLHVQIVDCKDSFYILCEFSKCNVGWKG